MGLIYPQTILLKWPSTNKEHYINLGYKYTKVGDLFECDVKHLTQYSEALVNIKCDFCDKTYQIPYKRYLKLQSDKYCCPECLKHKRKYRDSNGNLQFIEIPYRNKEWLYNEYIVKNREAKDIAKDVGINQRTLREWISIFGLTNKQDKTSEISKDTLIDLYVNKKLSSDEIGEKYNVSGGSILNLLKKFEIPARTTSEIMRLYYDFKDGHRRQSEHLQKIENKIIHSCATRGISIEEFDGFKSDERHMIRNSYDYKHWRMEVFTRDNFTCQACGKIGGNLQAHHIENFSSHPELRFDVNNGVTFCVKCHNPKYIDSFHRIYGCFNNTKEQVKEFILNKQGGGLCATQNTTEQYNFS